jgi:hypothetical protein
MTLQPAPMTLQRHPSRPQRHPIDEFRPRTGVSVTLMTLPTPTLLSNQAEKQGGRRRRHPEQERADRSVISVTDVPDITGKDSSTADQNRRAAVRRRAEPAHISRLNSFRSRVETSSSEGTRRH